MSAQVDRANMNTSQTISTPTDGKSWIRVLVNHILLKTKDHIDIIKYKGDKLQFVLTGILASFYSKTNQTQANKSAKKQVKKILTETLLDFHNKGYKFSTNICTSVHIGELSSSILICWINSNNVQCYVAYNTVRPTQKQLNEGTLLTCIASSFAHSNGHTQSPSNTANREVINVSINTNTIYSYQPNNCVDTNVNNIFPNITVPFEQIPPNQYSISNNVYLPNNVNNIIPNIPAPFEQIPPNQYSISNNVYLPNTTQLNDLRDINKNQSQTTPRSSNINYMNSNHLLSAIVDSKDYLKAKQIQFSRLIRKIIQDTALYVDICAHTQYYNIAYVLAGSLAQAYNCKTTADNNRTAKKWVLKTFKDTQLECLINEQLVISKTTKSTLVKYELSQENIFIIKILSRDSSLIFTYNLDITINDLNSYNISYVTKTSNETELNFENKRILVFEVSGNAETNIESKENTGPMFGEPPPCITSTKPDINIYKNIMPKTRNKSYDELETQNKMNQRQLHEKLMLITKLQIIASGIRDAMLNGHEPHKVYESSKCTDGIERTNNVKMWKNSLNDMYDDILLSQKNDDNKLTHTIEKQLLQYLKNNENNRSFVNPVTTYKNIKLNDLVKVFTIKIPHRIPQLEGEKGVCATMHIPENTVLAQYVGIEMTNQEWYDTFDYSNKDLIHGKYLYQFDIVIDEEEKPITIDPLEGGSKELAVLYVNDCRKDIFAQELTDEDKSYLNCRFFEVNMKGWPLVFFITTRNIKKGEEILVDYGKNYWDLMQQSNRWNKIVEGIRKISDKNIVKSIPLHNMHNGTEAYDIE